MEKIWVNNKGKGWFMACKGKDMGGNESCAFLNVGFKKGHEPKGDSAFIKVVNGWHTSYLNKQGNSVLKYMILDYEYVKKEDEGESIFNNGDIDTSKLKATTSEFITEDDLPFY